jgi:hypothetical protein
LLLGSMGQGGDTGIRETGEREGMGRERGRVLRWGESSRDGGGEAEVDTLGVEGRWSNIRGEREHVCTVN